MPPPIVCCGYSMAQGIPKSSWSSEGNRLVNFCFINPDFLYSYQPALIILFASSWRSVHLSKWSEFCHRIIEPFVYRTGVTVLLLPGNLYPITYSKFSGTALSYRILSIGFFSGRNIIIRILTFHVQGHYYGHFNTWNFLFDLYGKSSGTALSLCLLIVRLRFLVFKN